VSSRSDSHPRPLACVLAHSRIDVIAALGRAGIRCVAVTPPGDAARHSRHVVAAFDWVDSWTRHEELAQKLVAFARRQPTKPVLFYGADSDMLMVSRHRELLGTAFRFVIPDHRVVELLLDKAAFYEAAGRAGIPVPRSVTVAPGEAARFPTTIRLPVIVKLATRRHADWFPVAGAGKAIRVEDHGELDELLAHFGRRGVTVLVQESIPGPERRVESYHVYVDDTGRIVTEFAGRKIRTFPPEYGESTALETTHEGDVLALGREVMARLGIRGVAKVDFKRTPDGRLKTLEVNPRFNLWHHLGAVAGVNIPALVYADLTGGPRPPLGPARPGVRWCDPTADRWAARAAGMSTAQWARWLVGTEARSGLSLRDPLPFIRHHVIPRVRRLAHSPPAR
jgi:D-aspartate ligase